MISYRIGSSYRIQKNNIDFIARVDDKKNNVFFGQKIIASVTDFNDLDKFLFSRFLKRRMIRNWKTNKFFPPVKSIVFF